MRYHRHMRNWMIGLSSLFAVVTAVFSCLQVTCADKAIYAILNNISVCILTGALIALLQFAIGYHNAKYNDLFTYYKALVMLEERITFYPYQHVGFVDSVSGLKEVREILNFYSSSVQASYRSIDFTVRNDRVLKAAKELHTVYCSQMQPFLKFRDELCKSVRFMAASDEELLEEGVSDISKTMKEINAKLQSMEDAVAERYNDEKDRAKRNAAYEVLEEYLYGKRIKGEKE